MASSVSTLKDRSESWVGEELKEPEISIKVMSKTGATVRDHLVSRTIPVDGSTKQESGFDLLLIPGGDLGFKPSFLDDTELVDEIRRLASGSGLVASVCTGAFLAAQAGLANGKKITTHWCCHDAFRERFPQITLVDDRRFVQDGVLWSSAGISAGIDMALHLVISVWGEDVAKSVQGFLEYFPEPPFKRDQTPRCT